MEHTSKHEYLRALGETFKSLPTWQKIVVVVTSVLIWPAIALVALLVSLSLFPLALLGRWEGDLGHKPLEHEIEGAIHRQEERTRHFYSS